MQFQVKWINSLLFPHNKIHYNRITVTELFKNKEEGLFEMQCVEMCTGRKFSARPGPQFPGHFAARPVPQPTSVRPGPQSCHNGPDPRVTAIVQPWLACISCLLAGTKK